MNQLQHDTCIGAMRAIMDQLTDDIPYERRLTVMYLIYYSVHAALEKYEELVERREDPVYGLRRQPSRN